jgi:hypothetical protein
MLSVPSTIATKRVFLGDGDQRAPHPSLVRHGFQLLQHWHYTRYHCRRWEMRICMLESKGASGVPHRCADMTHFLTGSVRIKPTQDPDR